MDNDDALLPNALEKLFETAQKFNADVVHSNISITPPDGSISVEKLLPLYEAQLSNATNILLPDNLAEKVKLFLTGNFHWEVWRNLIRRNFVTENRLFLEELKVSDDMLYTFCMLCLSEKFILTPQIFYIWRNNITSLSKKNMSVETAIKICTQDAIRRTIHLNKFMKKFPFFSEHLDFKYAVLDKFIMDVKTLELFTSIPAYQMDALIAEEFRHLEAIFSLNDITEFAAFIFSRMSVFHSNLTQLQNLFRRQQQQFQQLQNQLFKPL